MFETERTKVIDALWKVIGTVRTNLRKHDFEFTSEDSEAIHKELDRRLHASDRGSNGLDRYWEHQNSFDLLGDIFWHWGISNKLSLAKENTGGDTGEDHEFDVESLRRMEKYLVENIVRGGLTPEVKKEMDQKVGLISHVA